MPSAITKIKAKTNKIRIKGIKTKRDDLENKNRHRSFMNEFFIMLLNPIVLFVIFILSAVNFKDCVIMFNIKNYLIIFWNNY